jgi:hypothetical protein
MMIATPTSGGFALKESAGTMVFRFAALCQQGFAL